MIAAYSGGEDWWEPWRILGALWCVIPYASRQLFARAGRSLGYADAREWMPSLPIGPEVNGQVLWIRDADGTRFGVVVPFFAPDDTVRWYLWAVGRG
jgi:hypothetical protein